MQVSVRGFLVYVMSACLFLSSCKPLSRDDYSLTLEEERQRERKWLKRTLVIGGAVAAVVGGYQMLKYLDSILGRKLVLTAEKNALAAREGTPKFVKATPTNPPLYKLTAPDGSEHYLLGTMHTTGLSLDDFPQDSKIFSALNDADVVLPERIEDGFILTQRTGFSIAFRIGKDLASYKKFDLKGELGDEYWQKLTAQSISHSQLHTRAGISLENMYPSDVISLIEIHGMVKVTNDPLNAVQMDVQLRRLARSKGKKVVGLEKLSSQMNDIVDAQIELRSVTTVDDLKRLLDAGGVEHAADRYINMVRRYGEGDLDGVIKHGGLGMLDKTPNARKKLLDDRNKKWVESNKIQKNCKSGQKCMVFVGFAHLFAGDNSLVKLLKKEGFRVEKM